MAHSICQQKNKFFLQFFSFAVFAPKNARKNPPTAVFVCRLQSRIAEQKPQKSLPKDSVSGEWLIGE
jgi:hypothetical protein